MYSVSQLRVQAAAKQLAPANKVSVPSALRHRGVPRLVPQAVTSRGVDAPTRDGPAADRFPGLEDEVIPVNPAYLQRQAAAAKALEEACKPAEPWASAPAAPPSNAAALATLEVRVRLFSSGQTLSLQLPAIATLADLKTAVSDRTGTPPSTMKLVLPGKSGAKELREDGMMLTKMGVATGSEMILVTRLRGGAAW